VKVIAQGPKRYAFLIVDFQKDNYTFTLVGTMTGLVYIIQLAQSRIWIPYFQYKIKFTALVLFD